MNKFALKYARVGILVLFLSFLTQSCFATEYEITNEATLNSALTDTPVTKVLDVRSDITLTNNLQTPVGTAITIYGYDKSLDGNSKSGLNIDSTQTLTIDNYGSQSGGTISASIKNFTVAAQGGFLYNDAGKGYIYNSVFLNNTAGTNGGAIASFNASSQMHIYDSYFKGNTATGGGGAVASGYTGTLNVYNSTFKDNLATQGGGAIISAYGGTATVVDSTFTGNYTTTLSTQCGGGAVGNLNSTTIINDSTFEGNGVNGYGTSSPVTSTYYGGAIANYYKNGASGSTAPKVTIGGTTTFTSNKVLRDGGAIYNESETGGTPSVSVEGATFTTNTAGRDGGAM